MACCDEFPSGVEYEIGNNVRLEGTFVNAETNQPVDPTDIVLKVKTPDDDIITILASALIKVSTGIYYYDLLVNKHGYWFYRFEGTGNALASGEENFFVKPSNIIAG